MTKVFKHKATGWQAIQDRGNEYTSYNFDGYYMGKLHAFIVENSNEWEEVTKEPYVFTEDAGEIYDKDEKVFKATPSRKGLQLESYYADEGKEAVFSDTKFFKIREHAEDYIQRKEPRYSNDDLEWIKAKTGNNGHEGLVTIKTINYLIHSLKSSKKH